MLIKVDLQPQIKKATYQRIRNGKLEFVHIVSTGDYQKQLDALTKKEQNSHSNAEIISISKEKVQVLDQMINDLQDSLNSRLTS